MRALHDCINTFPVEKHFLTVRYRHLRQDTALKQLRIPIFQRKNLKGCLTFRRCYYLKNNQCFKPFTIGLQNLHSLQPAQNSSPDWMSTPGSLWLMQCLNISSFFPSIFCYMIAFHFFLCSFLIAFPNNHCSMRKSNTVA